MLTLVNAGHKSLADYATIATRGLMDEIERLAEPLAGKRVLHLSATAFGGGVAEILYTLVPLMADVGLEVEWRIIRGADEFFDATKTIHNALQGNPQGLTAEQQEVFRRYNELNARELGERGRLRPRDRPRSAAGRHDRGGQRLDGALDLALPHRSVDAEPRGARLPAPLDLPLRRGRLPSSGLRAGDGRHAAGLRLAAGDRPADPEEHGVSARRRGLHRRPVRDRRRPAAPDAGVAVRSVEGPARA